VPIVTAQAVAIAVAHSVVAVSARGNEGMRRGTGVCVHRTGEILTSDRLVGNANTVHVTTADGVAHEARVVGRDTTTDLVLLAVTADSGGASTSAPNALGVPVQTAVHAAQTGDTVWVVGAPSPGDSSLWMSSGLVASIDSKVAMADGPTTSGLLETAAPSGTASSGGALVDRAGAVTGIVLSPVTDSRVTFAVPIATALAVAADLREKGYTAHGSLGVNGVNSPAGPRITEVLAGGPAQDAGVRVNDVVESVGSHEIDTTNDLMALVRHYRPGASVVLGLRRGTASIHVNAKLGSMVTP
jgi:S1-C subfamily serine protease